MENIGWNSSNSFVGNIGVNNAFHGNEPELPAGMIPHAPLGITEHNFVGLLETPTPTFQTEFPHHSSEGIMIDPLHGSLSGCNDIADETVGPNLILALEAQVTNMNVSDQELELHLGLPSPGLRVPENNTNSLWLNISNPGATSSELPQSVAGDEIPFRKRTSQSEVEIQLAINMDEPVISIAGGAGVTDQGAPSRNVRQRANHFHNQHNNPHEQNRNQGNLHNLLIVFQFVMNLLYMRHTGSAINEQFKTIFTYIRSDTTLGIYAQRMISEALNELAFLRAAGLELTFFHKLKLLTYFLEASRELFMRFSCQLNTFYSLPEDEQDRVLRAREQGGFWLGFSENAETFCYLPPDIRDWVGQQMSQVSRSQWLDGIGHAYRQEIVRALVPQAPAARRRARRARALNASRGRRVMSQGQIDVDAMSYEEIIALQETIGTVQTGLSEASIIWNVIQQKFERRPSSSQDDVARCSICLEDFNDGDDVGKMPCGHSSYHFECITTWLLHKNSCPICKAPVLA
ncbi:hypothetical protein Droror1_Dr00010728 [Drosera rotundifolia]